MIALNAAPLNDDAAMRNDPVMLQFAQGNVSPSKLLLNSLHNSLTASVDKTMRVITLCNFVTLQFTRRCARVMFVTKYGV
jgi:hypothetical protein